MKMEISKFKKIKEDHKSAVLRHPDGHQITIAKSALSPKMKNQLSALPMHFDEGGQVPDDSQKQMPTININLGGQGQQNSSPLQPQDVPPVYDRGSASPDQAPVVGKNDFNAPDAQPQGGSRAPASFMGDVGNAISDGVHAVGNFLTGAGEQDKAIQDGKAQFPQASPQPRAPQAPQNYPIAQDRSPGMATNSDPLGIGAYSKNYTAGINNQMQGLAGEAKAQSDLGASQAQSADQQMQTVQHLQQSYQKNFESLMQERQSLLKDIEAGHIDPNHYVNNMSTAGKVSTAIGLILGGMGGGLTGQENPAMKFLQSQIDRDIDAQKSDLGKKENLLSANLKQFGNLQDAMNMTRTMYADIYTAQLKKAEATAQSPLAKARAQQAIGALQAQAAPIMSQLATRQAMTQGIQSGHVNPAQAVEFMIQDPKDKESARKELASSQAVESLRNDSLQSFDHIAGGFMNGALSPNDTKSAKQAFIGKVIKESEGRYNFEAAQNLADALFPSTTDTTATVANKRMRMNQLFDSMAQTPTLEAYGIRTKSGAAYARPNANAGAGYKK